jgi:6-phospho-3-hexuloisomerase
MPWAWGVKVMLGNEKSREIDWERRESAMIKEISFQIIEEIKDRCKSLDDATLVQIIEKIKGAKSIFFQGLGRSKLSFCFFAMRLMHLGYSVHMVGDVTTPAITEGDLLFVISGSGETLSTLNMAKKAKSVGAEVILVTMVEKSSIADVADVKLVIDCPSAKHDTSHTASIQPMGSLFEQSVVLALDGGIISYLMHERNMDLQAPFVLHANLE